MEEAEFQTATGPAPYNRIHTPTACKIVRRESNEPITISHLTLFNRPHHSSFKKDAYSTTIQEVIYACV